MDWNKNSLKIFNWSQRNTHLEANVSLCSNIFHLIRELSNSQDIEEWVESIRLWLIGQTRAANSPFHTVGTGARVTRDIFMGEAVRILGVLCWSKKSSSIYIYFNGDVAAWALLAVSSDVI